MNLTNLNYHIYLRQGNKRRNTMILYCQNTHKTTIEAIDNVSGDLISVLQEKIISKIPNDP